ncbi:MAG TPA: hypothetical protein VFY86_04905 [Nocardioides sp.]|jgi:hypothetical protein|nr:hypothetical protein [uncultured Nocardioides sp.]HEX5985835.1 hypothetical protein [Nocardioides sp.]
MVHPIPRLATITTLVAAVTTTLAVAGTGVAHAQELSYADNASDVHAFQPDGSTVLVGDVVNTDVTSTTVDHRNKRVKATFRYTDLDRTGQAFVALLHLRTSDGKRFNLPVVAGPASWRGEAALETWNGKELDCGSLRHSINYDADVMKVSLDRECLKEPRWVQVALEAASIHDDPNLVYIDDAQHPDVPDVGTWSRKIRKG